MEKYIIDAGIILIKFWLEVGNKEQERRFKARIDDPLRKWKLSTMDLPSRAKWYEYSRARDAMLKATDTRLSPWYIVRSDDKKRARLNTIAHLLSVITPRPQAFFGWIVALATVVTMVVPFTLSGSLEGKICAAAINLVIGLCIASLLSGVLSRTVVDPERSWQQP